MATISFLHQLSVALFLLIYIIKTVLLLANRTQPLEKFKKATKVPEMIVSFLFLATGIYLLIQAPSVSSLMIIKLVCVFASIPLAVIGFKKSNKALATLSLVLIFGAYGLAEVAAKKRKKGDLKAVAEAGIDGQKIYEAKCVNCHGSDGTLSFSGATDLSTSALDQQTAVNVVTNGRNAMPAQELSPEQTAAVVEYIQTLKK